MTPASDPDKLGLIDHRMTELEVLARALTADSIARLAANVKHPASEGTVWNQTTRYWFSGTAGVTLTPGEEQALRKLWTRIQAALLHTHANVDVDALVRGRGIIARLDKLVRPDEDLRIQGQAATILPRALGKDVWHAVIGIWNASCAALLCDRLPGPLVADLERGWRVTLGSTPRDVLCHDST